MGPRDVFVEIGDEMAERLEGVAMIEGPSAPELLALGPQLALGLGANARGVLDWIGREATPEERAAILQAMGRQAILVQGEMVVARIAARMTIQEMEDLIPRGGMACRRPSSWMRTLPSRRASGSSGKPSEADDTRQMLRPTMPRPAVEKRQEPRFA